MLPKDERVDDNKCLAFQEVKLTSNHSRTNGRDLDSSNTQVLLKQKLSQERSGSGNNSMKINGKLLLSI